jgi:thymidylate synthase
VDSYLQVSALTLKVITIEEESVARAATKAIEAVRDHGVRIERTVGNWCMMKPGKRTCLEVHNVVITITNPLKRWNSRVNSGVLVETLDYLLGLNPGFTHKSVWNFYQRFLELDGRYPYTYGERIFGGADGIDQWKEVTDLMLKGHDTRHAHVTIYRPTDLFQEFVPCNFAWHFQTDENDKVDMITFCRSQDALRGLFLDCFAYTHFLEQFALAVGLPIGKYTVFETNLHIYSKDLGKLNTDFAEPTEPYTEGIQHGRAELLDSKNKRTIYEILRQIFEKREFPQIMLNCLPAYWKDWLVLIAAENLPEIRARSEDMLSTITNPEAAWTLKRILKKSSGS